MPKPNKKNKKKDKGFTQPLDKNTRENFQDPKSQQVGSNFAISGGKGNGTAPPDLAQLVQDYANYLMGDASIDPRQFGRTGEARFTPASRGGIKMPYGPNTALAIRYDDVDYKTYDAARFYPVLRDCVNVVVSAVSRAGCHFVSPNDKAIQLANVLIRPHVRGVNENLTRGALQFGNQVGEMVEEYCYNIKTSTSQSDTGIVNYEFPVCVGIKKFLYFDPSDTILLIDGESGDFAGIKQYVPTLPNRIDIPANKLVHYVNDREYDSVYGFAQTKSAIPFVKLAERLYDDMAKWADLFGAPYKVGKFRPGFTPTGSVDGNGIPTRMDNKDVMLGILDALNSGASVAYASEFDPATSQSYCGIELLSAEGAGADNYIEMLKHVNDMIRTAFGIPGYATSESPERGTYTLGKSMIDLFLRQVNARLDSLKQVWDKQVLERWNVLNFGLGCPPIVIEFEPPDIDSALMLMTAMIQNAASGTPLIDGNGQTITPDWAYALQSVGMPFQVTAGVVPGQPKPGFSNVTEEQPVEGGDSDAGPTGK